MPWSISVAGFLLRPLLPILLRCCRMPRIQFGPLKDTHDTRRTVWWHVPVLLSRWWAILPPLTEVEARVVFEEPALGERILCWSSEPDQPGRPEYRVTLRAGGPWRHVPVVARTEEDRIALAGYAGTSPPDSLYDSWTLRRGIVRVTDGHHFYSFEHLTDLAGSRQYRVRLEIVAYKHVLKSQVYVLCVPPAEASNDDFLLLATDSP